MEELNKFQAFRLLPIHLLDRLQIFNSQKSSNAQLIIGYLTIIPRGRVGYEMIDSQRGA